DNRLLIFLTAIKPDPGPLGFAAVGPAAIMVSNPDDPPTSWTIRRLALPKQTFGVLIGSACLLIDQGYLYGYGSLDNDYRQVFLVRWPLAKARAGELTQPDWWTGTSSGWAPHHKTAERPPALFNDGQTEFTVHRQG
ncbi:MAG: hypothetical protein HQK55_18170, partial [Deltaproteobacteria bacterium]|nr:hypothetical protein [Deltaproteobacteria bacterium]